MSKVFIEESTLSAIGNAIREKTGKSDLIGPLNMATEISSITTGGGSGDIEIPVITENCQNRFANNGWNWIIEQFGNKITTNNIVNATSMFSSSTNLASIPFDLNFSSSSNCNLNSIFFHCDRLTSVPKIINCNLTDGTNMFNYCYRLREIPEDFVEGFIWDKIDNCTSTSYKMGNSIFGNCYSLRSFPMEFLAHENPNITSQYTNIYYNLFTNCEALDEIVGLPVHYRDKGITKNYFSSTFSHCTRIKNIIFAVQEDGTPYTANWKNQVIELSTHFAGYANVDWTILNYNSGITADKEVTDDATYQALKNDPDWFTLNVAYCRYNHDSAVATLNSLPDTSAYGTNTIKFKGAAGSSTDGGAINTLTDEEIAVAAAKGWTVTLV